MSAWCFTTFKILTDMVDTCKTIEIIATTEANYNGNGLTI